MTARLAAGLLLVAVGTSSPVAAAENPYRLKPGAQGRVCLTCHADFQDLLKRPFVHKPVQSGDCVRCHSPHASSHGSLLAAETGMLCSRCHVSMAPDRIAARRSVHAPVAARDCGRCHDPHAAEHRGQLRQAGNALCYSCHAGLQKAVAAARFKHPPVERDCLGCHEPHSSGGADHLLRKAVPAMCTGCHRVDQPVFARQHMNYPAGRADCTSCHDPHGSDQGGMLWSTVHPPVVNKMCAQCHPAPESPDALTPKRTGLDLCRGCHSGLVNEMLSKNRPHWPAFDKSGCLNCHSPHASTQPALLKKPMTALCAGCHAGTVRILETSAVKHAPAAEGACATCHDPHASNAEFLFTAQDELALCAGCHDYAKHTNHPLGGKATDPRNPNVVLECSSCHAPHASPHKAFSHENTDSALCVQCHQGVRR